MTTGHAFAGGSWNGREGMILANNVLYSRDANGNAGVTSTGNVVFGDGPKDGCTKGRGLEDFRNLTWDASAHDATPTADAPLENADLKFLLETDFNNNTRKGMKTSGAVARPAL